MQPLQNIVELCYRRQHPATHIIHTSSDYHQLLLVGVHHIKKNVNNVK